MSSFFSDFKQKLANEEQRILAGLDRAKLGALTSTSQSLPATAAAFSSGAAPPSSGSAKLHAALGTSIVAPQAAPVSSGSTTSLLSTLRAAAHSGAGYGSSDMASHGFGSATAAPVIDPALTQPPRLPPGQVSSLIALMPHGAEPTLAPAPASAAARTERRRSSTGVAAAAAPAHKDAGHHGYASRRRTSVAAQAGQPAPAPAPAPAPVAAPAPAPAPVSGSLLPFLQSAGAFRGVANLPSVVNATPSAALAATLDTTSRGAGFSSEASAAAAPSAPSAAPLSYTGDVSDPDRLHMSLSVDVSVEEAPDLTRAHAQIRSLVATLKTLGDEHVRLQSHAAELTARNAEGRARLETLSTRTAALENERARESAAWLADRTGLERALAETREALAAQTARANEAIRTRDEAVSRAALIEQTAPSQLDLLRAQRDIARLEKELVATKAALHEASGEVNNLRAQASAFASLKESELAAARTVEAARASLQALKSSRDEAEADARAARAALAALQEQSTKQLSGLETTVADLSLALAQRDDALGAARSDADLAGRQRDLLLDRVTYLEQQLADALAPVSSGAHTGAPGSGRQAGAIPAGVLRAVTAARARAIGAGVPLPVLELPGAEEAAASGSNGSSSSASLEALADSVEADGAAADDHAGEGAEGGASEQRDALLRLVASLDAAIIHAFALQPYASAVPPAATSPAVPSPRRTVHFEDEQVEVQQQEKVQEAEDTKEEAPAAAAAEAPAPAPPSPRPVSLLRNQYPGLYGLASPSGAASSSGRPASVSLSGSTHPHTDSSLLTETLTREIERGHTEAARLRSQLQLAEAQSERAEADAASYRSEAAEMRVRIQSLQGSLAHLLSQLGSVGRLAAEPAAAGTTGGQAAVTPEAVSLASSHIIQLRQQTDALRLLLQSFSPEAVTGAEGGEEAGGAESAAGGVLVLPSNSRSLREAMRRLERAITAMVRTFSASRSALQAKLAEYDARSQALAAAVSAESDKLKSTEQGLAGIRAARAEAEAQASAAQKVVQELRNQLNAAQRAASKAEAETARAKHGLRTLQADLDAALVETEAAKTQAARAKGDLDDLRIRTREMLQGVRDACAAEVATMIAERDEAVTERVELKERLSAALQTRLEAEERIAALQKEVSKLGVEADALREDLKQARAAATLAEAARTAASAASKQDGDAAVARAVSEGASALAALRADHETELALLRTAHEAALAAAAEDKAAALAAAKKEAEAALADACRAVRDAAEAEAAEREAEFDKQLEELTNQAEERITKAVLDGQAALAARAAERERLEDELTGRLAGLRAKTEADMEEAAARHAEELQRLRTAHDAEVQRLMAGCEVRVAASAGHSESSQAEADRLQQAALDLEKQLKVVTLDNQALTAHADTLRTSLAAVEAKLADKNKELEALRATHETARTEVARLNDKLTQLQATHLEDLESVRQECQFAIQAAEDRAAATVAKAMAAREPGAGLQLGSAVSGGASSLLPSRDSIRSSFGLSSSALPGNRPGSLSGSGASTPVPPPPPAAPGAPPPPPPPPAAPGGLPPPPPPAPPAPPVPGMPPPPMPPARPASTTLAALAAGGLSNVPAVRKSVSFSNLNLPPKE